LYLTSSGGFFLTTRLFHTGLNLENVCKKVLIERIISIIIKNILKIAKYGCSTYEKIINKGPDGNIAISIPIKVKTLVSCNFSYSK
jgi:hypothetical protein